MGSRRVFLKEIGLGGAAMLVGSVPMKAFYNPVNFVKLTILHTNDVHSRVEPFPNDGSRNAGLGGAAKRAALISDIRKKEKNVLLFDSGDIFQGTPYFNFFGGELEMKLMSEMKYDASTMGNHDFDAGIEGFEKQLVHANFPILNANYDFSNTVLAGKTETYKIYEVEGIKIGVFGLGIELNSLVPKALYKETIYMNPIQKGEATASLLKNDLGCDYVVCLSHLGFSYNDDKVSDIVLAKSTKNIDLILGGHTHTFMKEPELVANLDQHIVTINQAGWAGILLGRLDIMFERNKKGKCTTCTNLYVK